MEEKRFGVDKWLCAGRSMKHTCPVCGYDDLQAPPANFTVCPCCGTEFGQSDFDVSHSDLRTAWVRRGYPWFDPGTPHPPGWDPERQLDVAGFGPPVVRR